MKFMFFFYPALAATLEERKRMLQRFGKEILPRYL